MSALGLAPAERDEADRVAAAELRAIEARAQAAMLVEAVEDRAHEVGPRAWLRGSHKRWEGTPKPSMEEATWPWGLSHALRLIVAVPACAYSRHVKAVQGM